MLVKAYEDADGGVISEPKTFTLGDKSLRGVVHEKDDHCETEAFQKMAWHNLPPASCTHTMEKQS